mgnify:CR=1 FL=1
MFGDREPWVSERLTIAAVRPGWYAHHCKDNEAWFSCNETIIRANIENDSWKKVTRLPCYSIQRMFKGLQTFERLFRLRVKSYVQIDDETFLLFLKGRVFFWEAGLENPQYLGQVERGNGPLPSGCCVDNNGVCYFGEYWGNEKRESVSVYSWERGQATWQRLYSFTQGEIRHIHAVQFDPFTKRVWVTTGDRDEECFIGYFEKTGAGVAFIPVAQGSQHARAASLLFTGEYVYWGSDAGKDTRVESNWIYRWSREHGELEQVENVGGPVYYSTMDDKGRMFFSTGVEGSLSERDRYCRIWMSEDGELWREIVRFEKDNYPMIFGYGLISFPQGTPSGNRIYAVASGVRESAGTWILEFLK